jgi:outer membrane protein assembly factor BamB
MGGLLFGVLSAPGSPGLLELPGSSPERVLVPELRSSFEATLRARFTEPAGASWVEPLDLTVMNGRIFVLDHAGEQVVEIDQQGTFIRSFNMDTVRGLELHHPHTMANDGTQIFIGNTFPPRIYVLDPVTSSLVREIVLPPGSIEGLPAVPTGMALIGDGTIVVADGQNHRLVMVRQDGTVLRTVDRPSGSWDLFKPGNINIAPETAAARVGPIATTGRPGSVGMTIDGTILALDILGPGVTRVRPDGTLATTFARPSDPVGGVFDPTDIAVDPEGRIFISDELLRGVQVYDQSGASLGVLGRSDPNAFTEPVDMTRPTALATEGSRLYVIDRGRGVVVYELPPGDEATAP